MRRPNIHMKHPFDFDFVLSEMGNCWYPAAASRVLGLQLHITTLSLNVFIKNHPQAANATSGLYLDKLLAQRVPRLI